MAEERQISEYGEFLKHLRIDKREMLKNMADKLGIKSSYLSAIESGNREIPPALTELICSKYNLCRLIWKKSTLTALQKRLC